MENNDKPTPEQVLCYLKNNPDFLSEHEDILGHLTPPSHHKGAGVVDFQSFMMSRLKNDKERAVKDRAALVEISRANMTILNRMHSSVLRLLDARSLEELLETLITELPILLDIDIVTIILEAGSFTLPHHYSNGIRLAEKGTIDILLNNQDSVMQSNITNCEYIATLYGKQATNLIKSHALIRMEEISKTTPALIAFASRNPTMFDDKQSTELVRFLTGVIERTLKLWLIK